jgi:hypothetical protein
MADARTLMDAKIVVPTPEKLDFALRQDPQVLNDVGLIVLVNNATFPYLMELPIVDWKPPADATRCYVRARIRTRDRWLYQAVAESQGRSGKDLRAVV